MGSVLHPKSLVEKPDHELLTVPPARKSHEPRQHRLMVGALVLLLTALGLLLYNDRDFWFPDAGDADQLQQPAPATTAAPTQQVAANTAPAPSPAKSIASKKSHHSKSQPKTSVPAAAAPTQPAPAPAPAITATRTALPPLEVEVVAGDVHRNVRPGSNAVHVDLQPGSAPRPAGDNSTAKATETTAAVTSNAAERVEIPAPTAAVVTHSVKPDYPLLARQMKVQGSVILQALIGKDGMIQDLKVVSGPGILAGAAREAVRQWHFKPHYLNNEVVETQARITVNFTISTN